MEVVEPPERPGIYVCLWMTNGNVIEYIKRNDSQRVRLVRRGSSR